MGIWSVWTCLAMRAKNPQVCCANNTCREGMSKLSRPYPLPDDGFVAFCTTIQPMLPCKASVCLKCVRVNKIFAAGAGCMGIHSFCRWESYHPKYTTCLTRSLLQGLGAWAPIPFADGNHTTPSIPLAQQGLCCRRWVHRHPEHRRMAHARLCLPGAGGLGLGIIYYLDPPRASQLQPLGFRDECGLTSAWAHAADHVRSTIFDEAHGPLCLSLGYEPSTVLLGICVPDGL